MHRPPLAATALAGAIGLALMMTPATPAATRVRDAATATWIHGMTEEIALREVGTEGVPELLELLADPGFPRRDNVVALLAYLAGDEATPGLRSYLEAPPRSVATPEEDRALLLVPEALGRIASRGGEAALATLLEMTASGVTVGPAAMREDLVREAVRGLELAERPESHQRLEPVNPTAPEPSAPRVIDGSATAHDHGLTWSNHVDAPYPLDAGTLDSLLADATEISGLAEFAEDVACCNAFHRSGDAQSFGTPGDGLDRIDSSAELNSVLGGSSTRVTVVRAISYCGGPGTNIIGCAYVSGDKMIVVRVTQREGVLWLHEYGHNVGLNHHGDSRYVMYGQLNQSNSAFEQSECNYYHNPPSGTQAQITDIGSCHDDDADDRVSSADNCPNVYNPAQVDTDGDGGGDACDGCSDRDGDGFGDPASAQCPGGSLADCNDSEPLAYPGAVDLCDSVDNDCDGSIDESLCSDFEADGDGLVSGGELAWIGRGFGLCANPPAGEWWLPVDFNADGCVDGDDLAVLGAVWGCASPGPACP